jgi:hypothetical protein
MQARLWPDLGQRLARRKHDARVGERVRAAPQRGSSLPRYAWRVCFGICEAPGVEHTVGRSPHTETIQVVFDSKLLRATDRAAGRTKLNRSALIRNAVREHLRRLEIQELEERDRKGYQITRLLYRSTVWGSA